MAESDESIQRRENRNSITLEQFNQIFPRPVLDKKTKKQVFDAINDMLKEEPQIPSSKERIIEKMKILSEIGYRPAKELYKNKTVMYYPSSDPSSPPPLPYSRPPRPLPPPPSSPPPSSPPSSASHCVASGFRNLKTRGKRMRGGSVGETAYNMFNKMNRQMVKNVMVPGMDFVAGLIPAVMGQPELTPLAVGAAHAIGTAAQQPLLELLRSDKRQGKLDQQAIQQREQEEEDALIKKYKISGKGIMNQPRSRSVGSDMLSPMAAATMGHSQAMNMKLKLEKDMAMGRRKQVGLVGVSGNLLGPGASPALQSQPQQNFQFRHTISSPVYRPHVYGNGLYA